jgi:hypothetical protein
MAQKKKTLSNDELAGRILVLEALAVAALGAALRFGRAVVPPEQSIEILNLVKGVVRNRIADPEELISASGEAEAYRYLDHVLSNFSEQVVPKRRDPKPQTDGGTG